MQENQETMLFEIEDYNYLLHKFCWWFAVLVLMIVVFHISNWNIDRILSSRPEGPMLIGAGFPYLIFEALKMALYIKRKDKREKIQFYPTYIFRTHNRLKISLDDIQEGYIAKYNTFSNKITWRTSTHFAIFALFLGPIIVFPPFLLGRFVYSLFKGEKYTIKTNNLLLLQKNYTKYCISVALNIAPKEEIEKINQYLNQYLNTDINKMEKILYKVPEWQRKNL